MNERMTIMVADVEKYLKDMEELNIRTPAELKDKKNFYSISMVLLSIFNRVIDIGQELIISKKLGVPATYAEIFAILRKNGIVKNKLFLELKGVIHLRNRLSHEYFAFTENDVFEGMKKTGAVKEFIRLLKASAGN